MGQTALNVGSGARTRWSAVFAGLWMLAILVLFSGLVGLVALPTLAGVLIVAGVGAFRIPAILTVVRTGALSEVAFSATLIATLLLPVAAAVGIGVALSLMLQLNREALDLRVVAARAPAGRWTVWNSRHHRRVKDDRASPRSTYTAASITPAPGPSRPACPRSAMHNRPVVIIRLRGRTSLGSTSLTVLSGYGDRLCRGGRAAVPVRRRRRACRTAPQDTHGHPGRATRYSSSRRLPIIGDSSRQAFAAAEQFLRRLRSRSPTRDCRSGGLGRPSRRRLARTSRRGLRRSSRRGLGHPSGGWLGCRSSRGWLGCRSGRGWLAAWAAGLAASANCF